MESSVVRFGILGCGYISWKVTRAMLLAEGAEPYAAGSRSLKKAQEFVQRIKDEVDPNSPLIPYGSYQEVLEDPKVDAVYIPLPTGLHLEWVVKAAEHGKHILLEKPVALSMKDLDVMLDACEKAGVQIMDCTMWVHSPRAEAMRSLMEDPAKFGTLTRVNSHFFYRASEEFLKTNIRVQKGLDELGCLGDIGWYCIRASLWAKDYELPCKVAAHPGAIRNEHGVLISCGGTLVWSDGVVATFDCGFDAPLRQDLQFAGTRGNVCLDDFTIPHKEEESSFIVEQDGAIVANGIKTDVARMVVTLNLPKPQEVLMIETLVKLVRHVKVEGHAAVDQFWRDIMWKTQKVVLAVDESASKDGAIVTL